MQACKCCDPFNMHMQIILNNAKQIKNSYLIWKRNVFNGLLPIFTLRLLKCRKALLAYFFVMFSSVETNRNYTNAARFE